jgi:predicted TPR repeat methyltransferase
MQPTYAPVGATLEQALALHRQGQFKLAEALYRQVLQQQPRHFDALHLLGVLAKQEGRPQVAIELIAHAIAVDPTQAVAYCNMGAALQELNRPEEALNHYDCALKIKPDYALALNNRGNALRNLGRLDEALLGYEQALRVNPDYAEALYNRGTALHKLQRFQEALASYQQAMRIKPDYADAFCNCGIALQKLRRYPEALASYERALQIDPLHVDAYCNQGTVLQRLRRYDEALVSYDRALQLKPDFTDAHLYRGNTLRALMRIEEAVDSYRSALEHGGDPEHIHYALAALGEGAAPSASPAEYVKNLFDNYADHFDRHLLDVLHYQTPGLLVEVIRRCGVVGECDSVDLGCGTGLCGPLLRPLSHTLSGVDLSPNMLEKARQRKLYDQLACGELTEFLLQKMDCYDLAVAADVLVYIGDLFPVFHAVRSALRAGGVFGFSVEESEEKDFALCSSHRFAHSAAYVKRLAHETGFVVEKMEKGVIRFDGGVGINGYLVVLTCSK